jgi:branched-chain amino acid transport system substrate-binding protein
VKEDVLKRGTLATALLIASVAALVTAASGLGKHALSPLPSSSCGPIQGSSSAEFLIASDLPLQGAGRTQTIEMTKAINFVLKSHNYKAGDHTLAYQSCDDSTAQAGKWDSGKCSANANAYARNTAVIGVIGTFNSGCAEIIIPILNRASGGPVGMVSPANTYVGLTHAGPGTAAGEPGKYYPSGKRNYIRVVAADINQGTADAILAKQLKLKSVYILNDKEAYGLGIANDMRNGSKKVGLKIAGFAAWDPKAASYEDVATKIKSSGAAAVFLGGLECENGGKLIKDLRAGLGSGVVIIAPDGFSSFKDTIAHAGDASEGMYVSIAGFPFEKLGKAAKAFNSAFGKSIGLQAKDVNPYSNYAATAAQAMLKAIAASDGSRDSVRANLFKTAMPDSPVGPFRINQNGDTTGASISIYKVGGGKANFNRIINPATAK